MWKGRPDNPQMATALNPGGPVKRKHQQSSRQANSRPIKPIFHTEPPPGSSAPFERDRSNESKDLVEKIITNRSFVNSPIANLTHFNRSASKTFWCAANSGN